MTRGRVLGAALVVAAVAVGATVLVVAADKPQANSGPRGSSGAPTIAGPLRMASCRDWNQATGPQRLGTVHQLDALTGGPVAGYTNARGPRLGEQQAYDMLERSCAPSYARAFKLYKLYGRSAAFVGS
jgi:hypothetical protein